MQHILKRQVLLRATMYSRVGIAAGTARGVDGATASFRPELDQTTPWADDPSRTSSRKTRWAMVISPDINARGQKGHLANSSVGPVLWLSAIYMTRSSSSQESSTPA